VLKPDAFLKDLSYWYYHQNLSGIAKQFAEGLFKDLFKRHLKELLFPGQVYAPGYGYIGQQPTQMDIGGTQRPSSGK